MEIGGSLCHLYTFFIHFCPFDPIFENQGDGDPLFLCLWFKIVLFFLSNMIKKYITGMMKHLDPLQLVASSITDYIT